MILYFSTNITHFIFCMCISSYHNFEWAKLDRSLGGRFPEKQRGRSVTPLAGVWLCYGIGPVLPRWAAQSPLSWLKQPVDLPVFSHGDIKLPPKGQFIMLQAYECKHKHTFSYTLLLPIRLCHNSFLWLWAEEEAKKMLWITVLKTYVNVVMSFRSYNVVHHCKSHQSWEFTFNL